ncbi:MAG: Rrf2 family transcriptional regulator [Candidatus Ratteibacteria bacterium]|nr:Rrf2 family transcriptional regulator [Candidatus Ratteibacteria bacterium]
MKLSTRGRYAARAMLDLAIHEAEEEIVLLKDIAKRENISERYLENIMRTLALNGLVISVQGRNGGFCLAKRPQEIKLSQIIRAVEGSMSPVVCIDNPKSCKRTSFCVTREIWVKVKKAMFNVLDSMTLEDMVKMQKNKLKITNMYNI